MRRVTAGLLLALGACCGPEPNTKSQAPYERYLGVRELGLRHDADAVREILKLLEDPHFLVVTGGLEALGDIGRKEFLQHVLPRIRHAHPMVREYACATIARLGNEEGIPALLEALKDPETGIRRAAIRALGRFGQRPEVAKALVEAVGEKEPSVVLLAHETLQGLTGLKDVGRSKEAWSKAIP
jgi:HEAT repeat protein